MKVVFRIICLRQNAKQFSKFVIFLNKLKCNQIYESTMKRKPYFHYKYKNVKGMSTYPEKAAYYENISCLSIFEMLFAKKCG